MRAKLIVFLIISTALSRALRAENEVLNQAIPVELRIYDVSDLTKSPIDFPAPDLSLLSRVGNIVDPFASAPAQSTIPLLPRCWTVISLRSDRCYRTIVNRRNVT